MGKTFSIDGNTVERVYIDQKDSDHLLRKLYLNDGSSQELCYDLPIPITYTCQKSLGTAITGNDAWALKFSNSTITPQTSQTQQGTWYAYPGDTLRAYARAKGLSTDPYITVNGTKVKGEGEYSLKITPDMGSININVVTKITIGEYWYIEITTTKIAI